MPPGTNCSRMVMMSSIEVFPVMSASVTPRMEVVAGGVKEGNSVRFCGIGA